MNNTDFKVYNDQFISIEACIHNPEYLEGLSDIRYKTIILHNPIRINKYSRLCDYILLITKRYLNLYINTPREDIKVICLFVRTWRSNTIEKEMRYPPSWYKNYFSNNPYSYIEGQFLMTKPL
jgi:hypothetical protein